MEVEVQVLKGDFHQSPDFSNFHANLSICHMFPGPPGGFLSKQRKERVMKGLRYFLCNVAS